MSNTDRIGIMERRRALEMAHNMLYSKVGKVVLDENKFPDRTLELTVKRIDVESKKNSSLIDNNKKMFKRARLMNNLEPTILMERPASPAHGPTHDERIPGYMQATKKAEVVVVTEMPPTIDAFTVLKRKTKNIWETKYTEEDIGRKFRSIVMKSPPLTEDENGRLDKGYAVFRPVSRNEEDEQMSIEAKRRDKIQMLRELQRSPIPDAQLIFITQLEKEAQGRISRSAKTRSSKSLVTNASSQDQSTMALNFNQFHLERFEKMRNKQKKNFYSQIKM